MRPASAGVLLLIFLAACDAPWSGPSSPSGSTELGFETVGGPGPTTVSDGILAAVSIDALRTQVLASAVTEFHEIPARPCQVYPQDADPCWYRVASSPDKIYLAVSTYNECYRAIKETVALTSDNLDFIHWIGKPQRACNLDLALPSRRLIAVSRSSLPRRKSLTVRLELQGHSEGTAAQTVLSLP
jgi:hypothetical protein